MTGFGRLILDTDIGSDLDDALALACIFGTPGVSLEGITTVYGDTTVRAGIAARLCELAGEVGFPIIPGLATPKSGKDVWWAGFEGSNFESLESSLIRSDLSAPEFLVDSVTRSPGEIDILAIGPLTNIAAAIELDPSFARSVRHLYVMGGDFGSAPAEHNFACDADAARVVFDSGIRCTVTGLEATSSVRLESGDFDQIEKMGPLGAALWRESASFLDYTKREWSSPHDPMSLLPLLFESRFEYSTGTIAIDGTGGSRIEVAPDGPARIVSDWSGEWVRTIVRELVLTACMQSVRP
jgi:purine nucleosidase